MTLEYPRVIRSARANAFTDIFKSHIWDKFQMFLGGLFPHESPESVEQLYNKFSSNVLTTKHRLLFMCDKLGIEAKESILEFVDIRNKIAAHASLEEVIIPREKLTFISDIAEKALVKYLEYS